MWTVVIDQIAGSGGRQRYEHEAQHESIADAVEEALIEHGLEDVVIGQYQITIKRERSAFSGALVAQAMEDRWRRMT